jgi:hypothetical protein
MSDGRSDLTFVYLAPFIRAAKGVLSEDDLEAIKADLRKGAARWPIMKGTGGFRKMRYAPIGSGKGKSGGVRIIYFHRDHDGRVSFATLIRKSETENLTKAERNQLAELAKMLKRDR